MPLCSLWLFIQMKTDLMFAALSVILIYLL
jgi:hypothetical protein